MKKLMILAFCSLLPKLFANAYDAYIDGIYYNISGDYAGVTYKFRTQNNNIYQYSSDYAGSVVIPEIVTYNNKTYSVNSIGEHAFYDCTNLTSITIPNSVTSIGQNAFSYCSRLATIKVTTGNTKYDSRNDCNAIIETATNTLIAGCSNTLIPEDVTSIGNFAFYGINNMYSITIPESVTKIGSRVFYNCSSLSSITIPECVTTIGDFCFYGCSGLTSVTLEGNAIMSGLSSSRSMRDIFEGTSLKAFILGNAVTSIGDNAFYGCSNISTITIPSSIESIGCDAFKNCSNLTIVNISNLAHWCNNISFIGESSNPLTYAHHLFLNGEEIKDLVIPENVTCISSWAFSGCSSLTSLTLHDNMVNIGSGAFCNCPRLKHIYVTSQIPADCSGTKTFFCTYDYARSNYDVYDYAVLHVPMGTKEEYAAAYEWRYFAKIKEDLDINGQVFYTTLSVNHAGDGYVQHYVKADEPYTLYIGSNEGLRVNTVLFNGEDVTDRLVDGYYTTPNITRPSKIVISFEQDPDGVADIQNEDNLHVYGNEGFLFVAGLEKPQQMSIYTLNGMLINSHTLESDTRIQMNEGTYIVKIGERTFKVLL